VNINATLLGQMITFGLFVWFTMRFVWPLLKAILDARALKISEGLAAAELGHQELQAAEDKAKEVIKSAHEKAQAIVEGAQRQADDLIQVAKDAAAQEKARIVASGAEEVAQAYQKARQGLQSELADLVVLTTEQFLGRTLTPADQANLVSSLVKQ
jgi:F-type H+-transporting ATPase subunit b